MSFFVTPSERESGEILGGGSWANEYSYKNPNTGKWEYTNSPRTYGNNGDMTYDEWMKSLGRTPGSYGASAADTLYNEWLKSVTSEGKGRMNGMGEFIVGTKPNEATTSKASQLGESTSVSANEESLSTSEDKGTDYSWITSADEETMPEQKSEYPNGMSEEEFNDYYTFAYGMTHGTPWRVNDNDERMPYYGDIELPSYLAEEAKKKLDKYDGPNEKIRKELQEDYDKYNNYAKALSDFVEKYKDKYKGPDLEKENNEPEPLEESKAFEDAQTKFYESYDNLHKAEGELYKFASEKGIDINEKFTETPFYKGYRELANLDALSDTGTLEKGKTTNIKDSITGAETKVSHNKDDSWNVVTSNGTEFVGKGNNTDNIASGLGLVGEDVTHSPDTVFGSVIAAVGGEPAKNYFAESYTGKGILDYMNEVTNAQINTNKAEDVLEKARTAERIAMTNKSENEQKEIMNAYASGKINAVQAANALARAQESGMIDINYNSIMSDIPAEKFKIEEPIGKAGEASVGKDSFIGDISNPKTADSIITKFEHLNEIKEELGKVDITKVTNEEEAKVANEKITTLTKNAVEVANRDFVTIYKELVGSGIQAKDLASNPKVKQFSQEAFVIGQDIYEKASELEAKTNELGLTNLDKKYIKKNLDEISIKVGQLDPEKNKAVGSYYSPGSNMNGTNTSQPTGINLSKEEVKSLADYANDIQSTKDAGLAIMKSAAFNGAENVTGGKYAEEWKNAKALETVEGFKTLTKDEWKNKLTWKDYFAAGAKGTLGTAVAILGGAVTAANPVLGILLMTVGTASATKAGLQITTDVVRSKSTNKEMMFGSGEGGKDVFRDIYNRSLESANIGDAKSIGTYTNLGNGALSIVAGLVELLENPVIGVEAIRSGVEDINKAGKGGLAGNLDTAVKNIYDLGVDISTFLDRNDLKPEALGLTENLPTFIPNVKDKNIWNKDYTVYADTENNAAGSAAASEYGSAESSKELSEEEKAALDTTYSGAREQAKNSNLATDYNAGMEKETNEAVSDKYVKLFKVMIDKEPDYIRKVLIAIPKNHSEREG